jgi:type I restriction enzyme S subunit
MTEGFPKVPLGEVAEINPRRPEIRREGSTPTTFVPMQAISETLGIIDKAEVRPFEKVAKGYTYFETGDVLFAKITPCMQNGKHAIAENLIDGMGFGTTEFHVLRPGQKLRPEWLLHYLRQDDVLQSAERAFTGSVGLQRIPDSYLEKLEIPLPTVETQDARLNTIRQVLKQSRLAIDGIEYQKDHAAHLVSALLRSAFGNTSPILAGNQPSSIADWTVRPLLDLARLESGHTPSRRRPEWWGGDVPWLALPDIRKLHGRYAYETTENTNDTGLLNSSARLLPVSTVCLCRDASIGYVTILGRPMATSQHFCNWICNPEKLDPEFLMYAFMASHDYLRELGSGSVLKTIYMPTIQSFHVCVPEIEEQRRIARTLSERLAAAEALRAGLKARLVDIERLPQRLLAAAFA